MNTLIEKLETGTADIVENLYRELIRHGRMDKDEERWHFENAGKQIIDLAASTIKQYQTWRTIASDEKPQDMQAYNLLLKNDSTEYPTLYSVGLFREYASGHVWLSLVEAETYIDESKILAWQPMNMPSDDFFESLQPPSEVQDDKPSD